VAILLLIRCVYADVEKPIPPQFTDKSLFLTPILNATKTISTTNISGITVPHHLLAADLIADTFLLASRGSYSQVIILSPDHFNLGDTDISIASRNFITVFGELETDLDVVDKLQQLPFVSTSDFFYREHGIQTELPFIKYYFPEVKIIPISFKQSTDKEKLDEFIYLLKANINKETLIVQSTDFSHYLPSKVADIKDQETIAVIKSGDLDRLFSLNQPDNLDSIAAQYVQMKLQKDLFGALPQITNRKNSQDYTKEELSVTTSYITQIYIQSFPVTNVVLSWDTMLCHFRVLVDFLWIKPINFIQSTRIL